WQRPFFHYLIKCRLVHVITGALVSEGIGECNSLEGKYRYRWVSERDLPAGVDKASLVSQERRNKNGGHWTVYRLENDDIYSLVNTILKMAKKRALVDAALSAGRLSDVFTQDIEDMPNIIDEQDEYITESVAQRARKAQPNKNEEKSKQNEPAQEIEEGKATESKVDLQWLKESLEKLQWADCGEYLMSKYKVKGQRISEIVGKLSPEQQAEFVEEVQRRLDADN
ncbi:MAG: hypothetical protein PHU23_14925, partial [Dehalococcoidales bacterium]|nr:hypothetical protein [Dehalococcoidales bacterium]